MRKTLAALVREVDARAGWHRIGIALGLCIIAIAVTRLVHILSNVDTAKVWIAIEATPHHSIAIAAVMIVFAYATLTCYDYFALRTVGYPNVPYRIAALGAFTSYSIGHNIGATVFTGGAIRYRIYSAWGLSVVDVAKMAFVTGLTFWLGNLFVLGIGIAYEPHAASAIDHLPEWINRLLGVGMLLLIAAYISWVARKPRVVGRASWTVTLPNARLTLVQIVIGVFDLGFSGLAMYLLLPTEASVDFVGIIVTFVTSTLLGFASHAPGGLGVFDASMLVALWQFEKEQLLAALLLFRLLYYIVPFSFALVVLGTREAWLALRPAGTAETPDGSASAHAKDAPAREPSPAE